MRLVAALLVALVSGVASVAVASDNEPGSDGAAVGANTDFERVCFGAPCGWSGLSPFELVTASRVSRTGEHSAALTTRGGSAIVSSRCLPLAGGGAYTLQFWYSANGAQVDALSAVLNFSDTTDCRAVSSSAVAAVTAPVADGHWRSVEANVDVPSDSGRAATIMFQVSTRDNVGTLLLDDVAWVRLP